MWWIKAAIQEYILRSWSLVKIGTTAAQKKLFFNLRRLKGKIGAVEDGDLKPADVETIATTLGVAQDEVVSMNRRMGYGGDASLNSPLREDGEGEWQDWLADDGPLADELLADSEERDQRHGLLVAAMSELNERERDILTQRRLIDEPETLELLSQRYGISRERVRQIEVRAFEKLAKAMQTAAIDQRLMLEQV